MSAAIVGAGLVTPFGDTPTQHAFFLRAGVPAPPPSPFRLREDGSPLYVRYRRGLGAAAPLAQRLPRMIEQVILDATRSCGPLRTFGDVPVLLCIPKARPGLREDVLTSLCSGLTAHRALQPFREDAGAFAALHEAMVMLRSRTTRLVVLAAVDSFISIETLDELVAHRPSGWNLEPPVPSEGAAAIALADSSEARRHSIAILGQVEGAGVVVGPSSDENDEPVDGAAMTTVLRGLPARTRATEAFGPFKVDLLRHDEWRLATARTGERWASGCQFTCLESRVGRLGAASGMANLVFGLAQRSHRTGAAVDLPTSPFCAWAISPDGTRGAAIIRPSEGS